MKLDEMMQENSSTYIVERERETPVGITLSETEIYRHLVEIVTHLVFRHFEQMLLTLTYVLSSGHRERKQVRDQLTLV